jgi:microcystin-dependent protein
MSEPFIGEIRQFAGNFAPRDWAFCAGQVVAISDNEALFTLIGTTYGGDGQTTFALPNLQGRVPIHVSNQFPLGQMGGSESVTLVTNHLPVHSHAAAASNAGTSDTPAGNVWAKTQSIAPYGPAPGNVTLNAASLDAAGGNQPHENRVPFVAVSYIIALFGIYPSQG